MPNNRDGAALSRGFRQTAPRRSTRAFDRLTLVIRLAENPIYFHFLALSPARSSVVVVGIIIGALYQRLI